MPSAPSTSEERMFSSKRYSAIPRGEGWIDGMMPCEDLHAPGPSQGKGIDRRHVHMLDRLGEEAAEHSDRVNGKRKRARNGPSPTAVTKSSAQTRSGTARANPITPRAA